MAVFKKTYTIEVEIDLDACNNDTEWALEDWECDKIPDFMGEILEDLENFIDENSK